ncbi:unnamed protein product [Phyllotreta striolata]|uniref:Uncharacterized protein n=1 Tax=Phyllotreta striolata TaxID=444603 RepID=A0A9N9TCN2_PHYSR|nr:unnamed protein product [Phyllotreta striolata]
MSFAITKITSGNNVVIEKVHFDMFASKLCWSLVLLTCAIVCWAQDSSVYSDKMEEISDLDTSKSTTDNHVSNMTLKSLLEMKIPSMIAADLESTFVQGGKAVIKDIDKALRSSSDGKSVVTLLYLTCSIVFYLI